MKKVTIPTSTAKRRYIFSMPSNIWVSLLNVSNSNTMAILIRLLATKMVANNFFGLDSNFSTRPNCLDTDPPSESRRSLSFNEKKATSAPEIRAEHPSNTNMNTKLVIWGTVKSVINKLGGSKSKIYSINLTLKRQIIIFILAGSNRRGLSAGSSIRCRIGLRNIPHFGRSFPFRG